MSRKSYKLALFAISGAAIGVGVRRKTKRIQERAKAEGRHIPYGPYEAVIKRPLDVVLSAAALVIFSPVMAVIGMLVKLRLGSPVIFLQERPGVDGTIFTIFKFRSMSNQRDGDGNLLPDEERLGKFGAMLRKTSMDELPEFINILRGDMAMVGPRPLLIKYLDRYNERQKHRCDVRPGLTGLAQISGRNLISWEDKLEEDVKYVGKITFLGDMKIILKTMLVVFKYDEIRIDIPEFMGTGGTGIEKCGNPDTGKN